MTFVQIEQLAEEEGFENEDYLFDLEKYNYIIGGRTALHDPETIDDYEKLSFILKNFEAIDPRLLEQIQYYYDEEKKPAIPDNA